MGQDNPNKSSPGLSTQPVDRSLLGLGFHLTARPWRPSKTAGREHITSLAAAVESLAPFQHWNADDASDPNNGAIIDPYAGKEVQYATPLFAFNVAMLLSQGQATHLAEAGARALDRATRNIAEGMANDNHGEFFIAAMVKALRIFEALQAHFPCITPERLQEWKKCLLTPREDFMQLTVRQNWRTFAMKGEWLRQQDGAISDGVDWIEACWTQEIEGGQRDRFWEDRDRYGLAPYFLLYHDHGADPETFAYNGAAAANLLDMLENGYDGPSAAEMRETVEYALRSSLLLLGGSGEAPAGGRTGEHIWNDTVYAAGFEMMAEIAQRSNDTRLAGQFRRASQLLLQSHARFQQDRGWFSITKNQFHSSLKHRYAIWSALTNYNGFTQTCLAEALLARKSEIAEQPTPAEIGGYAVHLDPSFSAVFLNAGGMQAQICTRGETDAYGGVQWHTLGITRFSRAGWDSRLGPGAGHVEPDFSDGISFSPVFWEKDDWTRVCRQPQRFGGEFQAEFVHPLLVRGTFTLSPLPGQSGPTFAMHLTLTPDGVLVETVRTGGTEPFGVLWPLLEFDGKTVLNQTLTPYIASTAYPLLSGTPQTLPRAEAARDNGGFAWRDVDGGSGGVRAFKFQYALGVDRDASCHATLTVNGIAQRDLTFLSTGSWDDRHSLETSVTLATGLQNIVRLEFSGNAEPVPVISDVYAFPAEASASEQDEQNFIALAPSHQLDTSSPAVRGGYGDLRPVRVIDTDGGSVVTFVYPRSEDDPTAAEVQASFARTGPNFSSVLGRVEGTLYVGRTSAGGEGSAIDLNGDGQNDVTFDQSCAFIVQIQDGHITAVETDRPVQATILGQAYAIAPFTPIPIG